MSEPNVLWRPTTAPRIFPFAGDGRWYWQDEFCEEPMGPFDSYRDAWRDYKAVRKSPEGDART